jgi:hypothetical protein
MYGEAGDESDDIPAAKGHSKEMGDVYQLFKPRNMIINESIFNYEIISIPLFVNLTT